MRGEKQGARIDHVLSHFAIAAIAQFDHVISKRPIPIQNLERVFSLPATLADDQELGRFTTSLRHQLRPDIEKQAMVLAPLDRAECHEGR
jgi:hypothetical protein